MKLEQYKKDSYEFSQLSSDLVRKLAFAGIAIVWIFKYDNPGDHLIPTELFKPLLFLIITLGLDLLQYLFPSFIWAIFYFYHEKKGMSPNYDLKASNWLSLPGWLCYYGKILFLIFAYYYISKFILKSL